MRVARASDSVPAVSTRADYARILRDDVPLIDVRAPVEFAQGAPRAAHNAPILTDDERAAVGTCHRAEGPEAARALGHQLVGAAGRAARVARWSALLRAHPEAALCCWRGGDRSRIAQEWMAAAGHEVARVAGGFKALRRAGIDLVDADCAARNWIVLGGRTGSGKTRVLHGLADVLDLEGLANHRGSAFGRQPGGQPTPVRFELEIARALLRSAPHATLVVEDESATIGRCALPQVLVRTIRTAPLAVLEAPMETRVGHIYEEYVVEPTRQVGLEATQVDLLDAASRIRKRLGGDGYTEVTNAIRAAFESGAYPAHAVWIELLLRRYYDPMYDFQLAAHADRVVFRGDAAAMREFLDGDRSVGRIPSSVTQPSNGESPPSTAARSSGSSASA